MLAKPNGISHIRPLGGYKFGFSGHLTKYRPSLRKSGSVLKVWGQNGFRGLKTKVDFRRVESKADLADEN
jgi:hypothetical protein